MQAGLAVALGLMAGLLAAAGLTDLVDALTAGDGRLPRRCKGCGRQLGFSSYVPLWRYTAAGACHACGRAQNRKDIWIEALAILGTTLLWHVEPGPALPLDLVLLWLAIVATVVDIRLRIIPNRLLLGAFGLGLVALWPVGAQAYLLGLSGAVLLLAIGFLIAWIGRGGFGFGDVKYLGTVGFLLGWQRGLAALLLAVVCGGLYAAGLLLTHKATGRDAFAFGPFIAFGSVLVVLMGAPGLL